jgi:hypothetical protein
MGAGVIKEAWPHDLRKDRNVFHEPSFACKFSFLSLMDYNAVQTKLSLITTSF